MNRVTKISVLEKSGVAVRKDAETTFPLGYTCSPELCVTSIPKLIEIWGGEQEFVEMLAGYITYFVNRQ